MPSWGVHLSVRPSVTFVNSVKTNKHVFYFLSSSGSHTILVFPQQMSWQYSDGKPPNGCVDCRRGRQKLRWFWASIWLRHVVSTLRPPSAIHSAATDYGELMTLVAGKRRSLLIARDDDELYDKKP